MNKIKVKGVIVELTGDEMAQIIWNNIKQTLLSPFLELNLITFDLSIQNRNKTKDQVTTQCAEAIKKYHIGIKCATITPDDKRVKEFGLKNLKVEVSGPGSGRESALRSLQSIGYVITSIKDVTPIPHNGCRPRKRRRV